MNTKDAIQYQGEKLVTHFAATGAAQAFSVLSLDQSYSFAVEGQTLVAHRLGAAANEKPLVIESFSSPQQATNALGNLRDVVRRRMKVERVAALGRGFAKYVVLPFGLVLFGLAMNVSVHSPASAVATPASPFPPGLTVTPPPQAVINPATIGLSPVVPSDKIATVLKRGAESGKYAVHSGPTKGEPVYVFEDPNCSHCRDFAPEVAKLSKTHPVYVIPVSTIGGDASAPLNAMVLCAAEGEREKKWGLALAGALDTVNKERTPTDACRDAAKANDLMYTTIGLRVTPTVFNSKGEMMPLDKEQSAVGVEAWLKSGG